MFGYVSQESNAYADDAEDQSADIDISIKKLREEETLEKIKAAQAQIENQSTEAPPAAKQTEKKRFSLFGKKK